MHKPDPIKQFILENLTRHQKDIIKATIRKFGLSRQAILKHMNTLIRDDQVVAHGKTRDRFYELKPRVNYSNSIDTTEGFDPKSTLNTQIFPHLKSLSQNVRELCEFSLSALFYNIHDHAAATQVNYKIYISHTEVHIIVSDNGIGLYQGIAKAFHFSEIQTAAVEIAKGHVTSDPENHAGDDLMVVIHLFDQVEILSSGVSLKFNNDQNDWVLGQSKQQSGTRIHLGIRTNSKRTCQDVFKNIFEKFRTFANIPVKLAQSNGEQLNSREQAQNLLHNIKQLNGIEFDFKNIDLVGPAFADELVRKTLEKNRKMDIKWVNTTHMVDVLMSRAINRLT